MDIISHTLTGVAIGTVMATISNASWTTKGMIILTGALGGALPDFDAISLWSKFDSTIGAFLNLNHSGKEIYFGKFWYSHHAAFHSILTPLVLITIWVTVNILKKKHSKTPKPFNYLNQNKLYVSAFFLGFVLHLLEDMPTPASVWGGVNLFYPSSAYIGGYGKIWWWNNYDLVLILISVIVLNLCINLLNKSFYKLKTRMSVMTFSIGLMLFLFQINTRPVDFSYQGHSNKYNQFEKESKQIQKEILGDKLFEIMTKIDNKIPLNF